MTFNYNHIIKKFTFNLSYIRFGVPSAEYTASSILDKLNGVRPVICFQRGPDDKYIDYNCDNQLTVRVHSDNRAELISNKNNQISPANHIKLIGSEITNESIPS